MNTDSASAGASASPTATVAQDLTASTMFNARLYDILRGTFAARFHIEFVNLCAFYSKVNETNVGVLNALSVRMQTPLDNAYAANTIINSLNWDKEDDALYRFMISFTNL
jgi:hypothetical protein